MSHVRLPTSKLALLLLGLCFQREGAAVKTSGEWVVYRWSGPRGGNAMVSVRADQPELVAILKRVISAPVAYVELAALLVALAVHGGVEGDWAYERAAELLHGPRTANSHRGRQVPPLRDWLRLMAEGYWRIELDDAPSASKGRKRQPEAPARLQIDGPLLTLEPRTVRPVAALAAGLRSAMFVTVPATIFLLSRPNTGNPHGNLPSVAARARMRIASAIAARWRQGNGQRIRPQELFEHWAGLSLAPVRRRRRVRTWTRELESELEAGADTGGPHLGKDTEWDERRPLRSLLRLLVGWPPPAGTAPAGPPPAMAAKGPSG